MKTVTLSQLRNMNEEEFSELIKKTIYSKPQHDFYLDQLVNGQYIVSYGEHPLQVFDSLEAAKATYFAKLDHI